MIKDRTTFIIINEYGLNCPFNIKNISTTIHTKININIEAANLALPAKFKALYENLLFSSSSSFITLDTFCSSSMWIISSLFVSLSTSFNISFSVSSFSLFIFFFLFNSRFFFIVSETVFSFFIPFLCPSVSFFNFLFPSSHALSV